MRVSACGEAGSRGQESIVPRCPCTTYLAALKVNETITTENDRFLISLLNPHSGCGAVSSTLQRYSWFYFYLEQTAVAPPQISCRGLILCILPGKQHIDKVRQQSWEEWVICLTCFACVWVSKCLLNEASAQHSQNSPMQARGQAPILQKIGEQTTDQNNWNLDFTGEAGPRWSGY